MGVGRVGGEASGCGGVRVDVNGEVNFCENSKQKKKFRGEGGLGGGGVRGGRESNQGLGWGVARFGLGG